MITKVNNTISYLKNLWLEVFLNKTDNVTDISDNSVLNATAFATAKVAQKALKDVAIVEAQIFPEYASGEYLDRSAALFGVPARQGALKSSTYVRVNVDFTQQENLFQIVYPLGTRFVSNTGIVFSSEKECVILKSSGYTYAYIPVRSEQNGAIANVDPNTIVNLQGAYIPGHVSCTNEYSAIGGVDKEDDEMFRRRILNHQNTYAEGTIAKFTQLFQQAEPSILKIMLVGLMEDSYFHIHVVSQNGILYSYNELNQLLEKVAPYFGLIDLTVSGEIRGVKLDNAAWYEINGDDGVTFMCDLDPTMDVATIRRNIQINLTKALDFRFWEPGQKVEWDDLLTVVKQTEGVKYVDDTTFQPHFDEYVPEYMLPRISSFRMTDLQGNPFVDDPNQNTLSNDKILVPYYYPAS